MKILITGTAGFIGYHLTQKLLKRGDTVVGIDNINDYYDVKLKHDRLLNTGIEVSEITYNKPVCSTKYPNYTFIKLPHKCLINPLYFLNRGSFTSYSLETYQTTNYELANTINFSTWIILVNRRYTSKA